MPNPIRSALAFAIALLLAQCPYAAKPWGVYQMLTRHHSWPEQLDRELQALGGQADFVLFFRDLSPRRGFPAGPAKSAQERSLIPVISLELTEWSYGQSVNLLPEIVDGGYDNHFRNWATEAKRHGGEIILRFGFEMNGDWFSWGKQPDLFKKAWRRVHRIFAEVGCENVKWMFSPNILWGTMTSEDGLEPYYPGVEFVDCIGIDGYNFGDHHDQWHEWQSYSEIFENTIDACTRFEKPIYLSEIGCADDPRKAAWIADFLENVSQDPRVQGFIYFNHFNPRKNEPNWRLDSDAETLEVFRQWAVETERLQNH